MILLRERVPIQVIFHYGVRMIMRFQRQTFLKPVIRITRTLFLKVGPSRKNYLISKIHLDNSKKRT